MPFSKVFKSYRGRQCTYPCFLEAFKPVLNTIFFPSHWLLSHTTIVETTDSSEKGMKPVTMTIINPYKKYWPNLGTNQRPPVLKSATLPTELWDPKQVRRDICWWYRSIPDLTFYTVWPWIYNIS